MNPLIFLLDYSKLTIKTDLELTHSINQFHWDRAWNNFLEAYVQSSENVYNCIWVISNYTKIKF